VTPATETATGEFESRVVTSTGEFVRRVHGMVICLTVTGNIARIGGIVTESSGRWTSRRRPSESANTMARSANTMARRPDDPRSQLANESHLAKTIPASGRMRSITSVGHRSKTSSTTS
jgi:hypothetical protein